MAPAYAATATMPTFGSIGVETHDSKDICHDGGQHDRERALDFLSHAGIDSARACHRVLM
jgi:hypothetical protein